MLPLLLHTLAAAWPGCRLPGSVAINCFIPTPQVILLSDGSVTRHLQLMTNQRVEVRGRCMGCVTEHMRNLQQLSTQDSATGPSPLRPS